MGQLDVIRTKIGEVVGRDLSQVDEAADLRDLVVDSIMLIDLAIEMQEIFDLALNHSDLRGVETLGDFISLIAQRSQGAAILNPPLSQGLR